MNTRFDLIIDQARAVLSAAEQDLLADMMAAYVASRAAPPAFTEDEMAELKRRHEEPFDPAPEHEVRHPPLPSLSTTPRRPWSCGGNRPLRA